MKKASLPVLFVLFLALTVPQAALAAGGPVPPVQGSYIGVAGGPYKYAAFNVAGTTVVKRQITGARRAALELLIRGHYGIPGVDYSGAMTGLSADGHTLVLAEIPRNTPPRATRLLVLDTPSLTVRSRIALAGWSTVDAISPNGRWLYLIHYPSSDISRYEVLAYDLLAGRLLRKPVVDPRDRGEAMTGFPIDRVMSADGRWAYTLYFRPSGVPFVHALDTTGRRAVCIDLPALSNLDGSTQLRLAAGGTLLEVSTGGGSQPVVIDTRSFAVGVGNNHPAAPPRHRSSGTRGQGSATWELAVLLIAGLGFVGAATAGVARSRRRGRSGRVSESHA